MNPLMGDYGFVVNEQADAQGVARAWTNFSRFADLITMTGKCLIASATPEIDTGHHNLQRSLNLKLLFECRPAMKKAVLNWRRYVTAGTQPMYESGPTFK